MARGVEIPAGEVRNGFTILGRGEPIEGGGPLRRYVYRVRCNGCQAVAEVQAQRLSPSYWRRYGDAHRCCPREFPCDVADCDGVALKRHPGRKSGSTHCPEHRRTRGRVCTGCGKSDSEAAFSRRDKWQAECQACGRARHRNGDCACGKPARRRHVKSCEAARAKEAAQ